MNLYINNKITKYLENNRDVKIANEVLNIFTKIESYRDINEFESNQNIKPINGSTENLYLYRINGDKRLLFAIDNEKSDYSVIAVDIVV